MSNGRSIVGSSPCAYRVVKQYADGRKSYKGPYSTAGAAKGVKTATENEVLRWHPNEDIEVWVEKTPDGWERVDA